LKDRDTEEQILEILLDSEYLHLFDYKMYDRTLKQVDLWCDPLLTQEAITAIQGKLREEAWGKLTVCIFRREKKDGIV